MTVYRTAAVLLVLAASLGWERPIQGAVSSAIDVRIAVDVPLAAGDLHVRLAKVGETSWTRSVALAGRLVTRFGAVPSGAYRITVDVNGNPVVSGDLDVGVAETLLVAVRLSREGAHRVEVGGRAREGEGARFDSTLLADLPAGFSVWPLLETAAPFVVVDAMDTGGAGLGRTALAGSRGESWALAAVETSDARVTPAGDGSLPIVIDTHAVGSVAALSGLAPLDTGTPGVVVVADLVRPTDRWRGGVEFAASTPGMAGENALADAASITRLTGWRDGGLFIGGPISAGTGLFLAVRHARAVFAERDRPEPSKAQVSTAALHVVRRVTAGEWRVAGGFEDATRPLEDRRQFARRDVTLGTRYGRTQVTWDSMTASGAHRSLSFGGHVARREPNVASTEPGGLVDRVTDGVVPEPATRSRRTGFNIAASLTGAPRAFGGGTHALRVAARVDHLDIRSTLAATPDVAESVAGLSARVWRPIVPASASAIRVTEGSVVLADRVTLGARLTVDLGLRVEGVSGQARGAERGIQWFVPLPRATFRWQPGRLALYGGGGDHVPANVTALAGFGDPGRVVFDVHRWVDLDRNGRAEPNEVGILVARRGRGQPLASIAADLGAPRTREWSLGAEWQTRFSTVGGAMIIRRARDLIGSVNLGVPSSSYRMFTVPDIGADEGSPVDDQDLPIFEQLPSSFGADRYQLTNPEGGSTSYDGIELYWTMASPRWRVMLGATAYRAIGVGGDLNFGPYENDQLVIGTRFESPNAAKDTPWRLFSDRAYVGKWAASYRAPGDVRLAAIVRYQDGQPFTRLVVAPDLASGPEIVHAYRVGQTRFTYTGTIDLRVEKGLTFGSTRAAVRLDVFNLSNLANEVEEDVLSGPRFRRSTAVQPPRTLRVGFGVDF